MSAPHGASTAEMIELNSLGVVSLIVCVESEQLFAKDIARTEPTLLKCRFLFVCDCIPELTN